MSRIICKDLHLKCFKSRRRAQELTDTNCAARMKRAKLLLQQFRQSATDFVFFTDEKVFSVTSPDNQQNKVSGRLRELLKKKHGVFFSAGTARSIPLPGRLLTVPVSRSFLNSLLTPHFFRLFSGNSSVNLFAMYPYNYSIWATVCKTVHHYAIGPIVCLSCLSVYLSVCL